MHHIQDHAFTRNVCIRVALKMKQKFINTVSDSNAEVTWLVFHYSLEAANNEIRELILSIPKFV